MVLTHSRLNRAQRDAVDDSIRARIVVSVLDVGKNVQRSLLRCATFRAAVGLRNHTCPKRVRVGCPRLSFWFLSRALWLEPPAARKGAIVYGKWNEMLHGTEERLHQELGDRPYSHARRESRNRHRTTQSLPHCPQHRFVVMWMVSHELSNNEHTLCTQGISLSAQSITVS